MKPAFSRMMANLLCGRNRRLLRVLITGLFLFMVGECRNVTVLGQAQKADIEIAGSGFPELSGFACSVFYAAFSVAVAENNYAANQGHSGETEAG
jgi:hypothetical protein